MINRLRYAHPAQSNPDMTFMRLLFTLVLFALFTTLASTAHAVSFDCSKPTKPVERMICETNMAVNLLI